MQLRIAAGVCALSTGLLIGSPAAAIAVADSGSDGAATHGDSADGATAPAGPARGPIGSIADSLRKAVQDATLNAVQGVASTAKSGLQQASSITPPRMNVGGTPTVHGSTGSTGSPSEPTTDAATEPASGPAAEEPASEPSPKPSAAAPPVASVPNPAPAVPDLVTPVSNVLSAVAQSAAAAPALLAALPTSVNPVSDVLASLQGLLTSVADAGAPLAQFPTDLAALLGGGAAVPGSTVGGDGIGSAVDTGPLVPASVQAPAGRLPLLPGVEVAPTPDVLTGLTATPLDVTTTGTSTGVASPSTLLAPAGEASSALSIVKKVIGAVVATVSLAALAAMALPGILGLLGTCAAGIRIGYRQAKAGSELPATAIARFVGSGPIGVVRSGSQISLRPRVTRSGSSAKRATRVDRPVSSSPAQLLDRVG